VTVTPLNRQVLVYGRPPRRGAYLPAHLTLPRLMQATLCQASRAKGSRIFPAPHIMPQHDAAHASEPHMHAGHPLEY
jgi:hypothetical protein